jgi:hypothetical protein
MRKYEVIILILFIFLDSFHILFHESDLAFDIYKYEEHERYLCNIIYDLQVFFGFAFLFLILWIERSKYYLAFFIWWCANVIGYFLFYAQKINLVTLFILLISLYLIWRKDKK